MKYIDEIIDTRKNTFLELAEKIYSRDDIFYPVKYNHIDLVSNFAVPVVCKSKEIRDEFVEKCNGIVELRPIVGGDMTKQPFFNKYSNFILEHSNAGLIHEQGLYFGNNPELSREEIDQLLQIFTQ
jgi:CDP-6-deoxy-D-xylo-4-hexulose-3-dehydrase